MGVILYNSFIWLKLTDGLRQQKDEKDEKDEKGDFRLTRN